MENEDKDQMANLWTSQKLASAAGVSSAYIRRLLFTGKLQGRKIAKTWLIPDDEARRWLAGRGKDSTPG